MSLNGSKLMACALGVSLCAIPAAVHAQSIDTLPLAKQVLLADPDLKFDPYSVLVRFVEESTPEQRAAAIASVGGSPLKAYDLVPGLMHIEIAGRVEDAIAKLSQSKFVAYAEPDFVVKADAVPNDPNFSLLWGMQNTGQTVNADPGVAGADARAAGAWDIRTGDANFVVAIIDSGTLLTHVDLAANIWTNPGEIAGNGVDDDANGYIDDVNGWDFFSIDNDPNDGGHGTHTAGTVGAVGNNGVGVAGMAWNCKLMALRFLGPTGGFTSDAILAVQYTTQKAVKVSNNSWGGGGFSQGLFDAIAASRAVGHVFVASAGNNGQNSDSIPSYPAAYNLDNIISVAATDNNDARASFSNFGPVSVDLGAPGVNILSTYGTTYAYLNGTSMAGPHVAGVAALVYMQNPTWTYTQVKNQILSTARPIAGLAGLCVTGGVVNAAAALGSVAPPPNAAPVVTITAPAAGATFTTGVAITFTGSANDAEDGNRTASLVWTSSLQGQIGVGGSFTVSNLVAGSHTITARATDTAGLAGTSTRTITVAAPAPPTAPNNPRVTRTGTTANVSWRDRSNNETGFQVRRETLVNGVFTNQVVLVTTAANVQAYANTGLAAGTYRYSIRAVNGSAASAWTAWVQIVIP
jgi:large repetitive protein